MTEKIYFIENTEELELALVELDNVAVEYKREFIEMDYSKITVNCMEELVAEVEKILSKCI